jgi:hypothetical protein
MMLMGLEKSSRASIHWRRPSYLSHGLFEHYKHASISHSSAILALALSHVYDVLAHWDVPDVPDAASDSLNATPVLKLSSYLSPQRKQLQGCQRELLPPATDDLASTDR